MPIRTTPLSGSELVEAIESTGVQKPAAGFSNAVYDTREERVMVAAQQVLFDSGYHLADSKMIEGDSYVQVFVSHRTDKWPEKVTLRYTTNGFSSPRLILMYQQGVTWVPVSGRFTYGTETSNAEKDLVIAERDHPHTRHLWIPAFTASPLIP